jgi:hypothetical protein
VTRRADIGSDSLNANERLVLEHWDAGLCDDAAIVAATGLTPGYVRNIISHFAHTEIEQTRFERNARIANAKFLAAIASTGGSFA